MCWHHGGKLFPILSVLVINVLHKHFIMSDIYDGGTSDMIYITYSNFIAIAIKWFFQQRIENLWCTEISNSRCHYCDAIMGTVASQITSLTIVYTTVYSDADQSKRQSSASLAFVRGIHRGPVNSPHKGPVTRKMFLFDDVIVVML